MRGATAGLVALAFLPLAACVEPDSPAGGQSCRVAEVVDGDTLGLACEGGPEVLARLKGVDAPEIARARCPAERAKGQEARRTLERLVAGGAVTRAVFAGKHSDGRSLVALEIDGRDVGQAMIAAGMARAFSDEVYPDWCAGQ